VWREGKTLDLILRPGPLEVILDTRPASAAILAQRDADALLRQTRGTRFHPLPGTRREVQAIASLFDSKDVYLGSEADEQTLESLRAKGELGRFAVIHPVYDGSLTAGEVMSTWKLSAELVVLSACQSGLGRSGGGEGFIGFAQAFFLAGARSLMLSLWEVDDRATSLLMTRFYRNWLGRRPGLAQPLSKAEALREAKAWLRGLTSEEVEEELTSMARGEVHEKTAKPVTAHPFAHPHYWAGFILMGDPN
jgi:CHAT domain-containing protein